MSKAFTREDLDPPEKSGRARSASGLPPGATNYITRRGAARLRQELLKLRSVDGEHAKNIAELERILASVSVVEPPEEPGQSMGFGARVTVRDGTGQLKTYRVMGVDELHLEPDAVSWISPIGRTLLAAECGQQVTLPEIGQGKIVKVEYPAE